MSASQQARNKALHQRIADLEAERDRQVHRALCELAKAEERIADLERIACGNDLILRDTSALATHWRGRAAELDAQVQRADAKIAELEGILQSHEIVLSQADERAQILEGELKVVKEYRDMWRATARGQDERAQKAEAEVAGRDAYIDGLRALCGEAAEVMLPYSHHDDIRGMADLLAAAAAEETQELRAELAKLRALCAERADMWRQVSEGLSDHITAEHERSQKAEAELAKLRAVADAAGNLSITADGVTGDATDARVLRQALEAAR